MGSAVKNRQSEEIGRNRVAVAMSGGVDSSAAAGLLVREGYDVVGLTMKLFDYRAGEALPDLQRRCCNVEGLQRAETVCRSLNIPHYSIDLRAEFKYYIIQDFISEYIEGRTPNPCVRCNTYLKWGSLFEQAQALGCDRLATGHYARLQQIGDEFHLLRASDRGKDQVYALWGIPADKLPRTLFPLGSITKRRVRQIAADLGLESAQTPESQEICFIPDGHYSDFLITHRPDVFGSMERGELLEEGVGNLRPVGRHPGYPFYTVGQRQGLGGGYDEARYVLRVESETNRVIIGKKAQLFEKDFLVDQLNWLIPMPVGPIRADVQVRYRSRAAPASISPGNSGSRFMVQFDEPVEAIAPGQSAVFFQGERLIGGGRIIKVLHRAR